MLHGLDCSTYQGQVDWAAVKDSGQVDFAFSKATEGVNEIDDQFARNAQVCRERGIAFGAYHFFHPDIDGESQARHFITVAKPAVGNLVPMVDVEIDSGCSADAIIAQLAKFTRYCEGILKTKIIIYTDYGFWNDNVAGSDAYSGHPLWIAEYNHDVAPTLPSGWHNWTIWQHCSTGQVPGITGDVDLDVLNPAVNLRSITL